MPKREGPDSSERNRLRWELMRREKFFWEQGDIRLVHPVKDKDASGRVSSDPREGDSDPDPGRG